MSGAYRSQRARRTQRAATGVVLSAAAVAGSLVTAGSASAAGDYTVIAHRGDHSVAPELTYSAFGSAIRKGVDAIEMDVQFSKTGYPVVIHDYTLDRTTNCSGPVKKKTVTQLQKCDAGSWFSSKFAGEKIPTLYQALAYVRRASPDAQVILHMKVTPTRKMANLVMHRVKVNKMADRTIVMGSNVETMSTFYQAGAKRRAFIFNSAKGWDHKYKIMVPYNTAASATEVRAAHNRGAKVWTVESHPNTVKGLLNLSVPVDGIMLNKLSSSVLDLLDGVIDVVSAQVADEPVRKVLGGQANDETSAPRG